MDGTISQLDKGGRINKTSDQIPVVLLNSVYQFSNYIITSQQADQDYGSGECARVRAG